MSKHLMQSEVWRESECILSSDINLTSTFAQAGELAQGFYNTYLAQRIFQSEITIK